MYKHAQRPCTKSTYGNWLISEAYISIYKLAMSSVNTEFSGAIIAQLHITLVCN